MVEKTPVGRCRGMLTIRMTEEEPECTKYFAICPFPGDEMAFNRNGIRCQRESCGCNTRRRIRCRPAIGHQAGGRIAAFQKKLQRTLLEYIQEWIPHRR